MAGILVFVEQRDGVLKKSSLEAASVAKKLADERGSTASAVIIGSGITELAATLGKYAIEKTILVDDEAFASYSTESYGQAIIKAVESSQADVVVFSCTAMGKDIGPYLSAKLNAALATDVTEVKQANPLQLVRPVYAGKANATVSFPDAAIVLFSIRPNVFAADECGGNTQSEMLAVEAENIRARVKEIVSATAGKVELTEAEIIVSGGRGMKDAANFNLIEALAETLGAAVGASRAVVDAGWRPHSEQVGQTGKVVTPNLYIACGISGAVQHLAGMSGSKVIVAVNKDPEAPIFQVADYGIVGDAMEVLPVLTEEFKKILA